MNFSTSITGTKILNEASLLDSIELSKPFNSPEQVMSFESFKVDAISLQKGASLDHLAIKAIDNQMINQTSFEQTKVAYEFSVNPPEQLDTPTADIPLTKVKL